jgi:hypothetical protein
VHPNRAIELVRQRWRETRQLASTPLKSVIFSGCESQPAHQSLRRNNRGGAGGSEFVEVLWQRSTRVVARWLLM